MNGETAAENKQCLKCLSLNLPDAVYCKYCHEKFSRSKTFVERKKNRRFNRSLIFTGGVLAAVAGCIFKRRNKAKDQDGVR